MEPVLPNNGGARNQVFRTSTLFVDRVPAFRLSVQSIAKSVGGIVPLSLICSYEIRSRWCVGLNLVREVVFTDLALFISNVGSALFDAEDLKSRHYRHRPYQFAHSCSRKVKGPDSQSCPLLKPLLSTVFLTCNIQLRSMISAGVKDLYHPYSGGTC